MVGADGTVTRKIILSQQVPWAKTVAFVTMCDAEYRCTAPVDITIA